MDKYILTKLADKEYIIWYRNELIYDWAVAKISDEKLALAILNFLNKTYDDIPTAPSNFEFKFKK